MKILKCAKCGNMVLELVKKPCDLMCCGEKLIEVVPNITDASKEKHVPAVTTKDNKVIVSVGEVPHPMQENHYITFIALETSEKVYIKQLTPSDEAKAEFILNENEIAKAAYENCNLHGFWKKEIN